MTMKSLLIVALVSIPAFAVADDVKVGNRATELDIAKDEAGKSWKLEKFKDKWVLMTFGAHWCKPCANELPVWDKLAPKYKDKIAFVAVNISNKIEDGKKFNKKLKLKNLIKVYLPQNKSTSDDQYDTGTFPSTFIIDPKGIIRAIHKGFESGDDEKMIKAIDELVK